MLVCINDGENKARNEHYYIYTTGFVFQLVFCTLGYEICETKEAGAVKSGEEMRCKDTHVHHCANGIRK
jgi:hypothetical protein